MLAAVLALTCLHVVWSAYEYVRPPWSDLHAVTDQTLGANSARQLQPGLQLDPPWHLDRIDQRSTELDALYSAQALGDGVNIYVVSAGVNGKHVEFESMDRSRSRVVPAYTLHPGSPADVDIRGEGTIAAGLAAGRVYGVAKAAQIHSVKVFRDDQAAYSTPKEEVIKGLRWIIDNHVQPAVVLWVTFTTTADLYDGDKESVLRNMTAAGLPVIVSAGFQNLPAAAAASGTGLSACDLAVSSSGLAFTVSASTSADTLASVTQGATTFRARNGPCVDMYAPGSDIMGPARSPSVTQVVRGTSPVLAPALAAGVAAIYLDAFASASPGEVYKALKAAATPSAVATNADGGLSEAGPLLYSRVLPINSGMLPAQLFGLHMEMSATGARQSGPVATLALLFERGVPQFLLPEDIKVQAGAALVGTVAPEGIVQLPSNARAFIISVELPADLFGQITVTTKHATSPLVFERVALTVAQTTAHALA